ncbi:MAG: peptidylprolyl isomerase [Candidatus Zixiibacteriota bacterium]|nr:MAG: peptidylprolyl isomerase [candidate division Zixibacteria bacterium]
MFDFLRRMIVPIILIALIGFLATIIFQWGMDITSRRQYISENTAAIINGEDVSWQDFDYVYNSLYQTAVYNTDEDLSDFRKQELRSAAWQQILHDRLIMQEVEKYGITVSNEELYAFLKYSPPPDLQQHPAFRTDGVFDRQKYMSAMADPSAASFWARLEPIIRREILKQKLQELVIQSAQVTNQEVRDAFWAANEKVKVGMVNVSFSRFTPAPSGTEEQLQSYFQQHGEDYRVGERAVLNLVMISKEPQAYDWEVDSSRAVEIYDSLVAGADFAEMARYYSEDMSAEDDGDLGWFRQGQMVPPFDEKVFSMKAGEFSEPVKTRFGWHLIKVHEFRDAEGAEKVREAHASHILFKVTASTETLDRVHNRLDEFRSNAGEYGFAQTAENFELEFLTTAPFERGSVIEHIGYSPEASDFAFTEEINAISNVLENQSYAFVLELAERLPAGIAPFESVRELVKKDYDREVIKELCHDTAMAIYSEIQNGTDINRTAAKYGAEYTVADEFTRNASIRGLGIAPEAVGAAFGLTEPGEVSEPVDYENGTVILKLVERIPADTTRFAAVRDSVYYVQLTTKQQELYGNWFDYLVEHSEILNNIEAVYQGTE